jgi:hypothetical protein
MVVMLNKQKAKKWEQRQAQRIIAVRQLIPAVFIE